MERILCRREPPESLQRTLAHRVKACGLHERHESLPLASLRSLDSVIAAFDIEAAVP
jgi:hypothetical protein